MAKLCQPTWLLLQKKKLSGGWWGKFPHCSQIPQNRKEATTKKRVSDTLAEKFSVNSSLNNSNPHFLTFKSIAEKQKLNFKSKNWKKYNQPFTPAELQEAIETSQNTEIRPDEIHPDFLKHLPKTSLDYLLKIYNKSKVKLVTIVEGDQKAPFQ